MRGLPSGPVAAALAGAALFGISVPAQKALLDGRGLDPVVLAGTLYLASGVGLGAWQAARGGPLFRLPGRAWGLLLLVAAVGGVAAPLALAHGLARAEGQAASLLLALEGGFTAVLAAAFFREHVGRHAGAAVALAVLAAVALAEPWAARETRPDLAGLALVAGATLGWALDNNLSRALSDRDPVQIAALKGLVAGPVSLGIAAALGRPFVADPAVFGGAALVGLLCYGVSLVCILRAFAGLGATRTMAIFSAGPAFGVAGSWIARGERPGPWFAVAAGLLGASLWLLSRERHEHEHEHEETEHEHEHVHDDHHRHDHEGGEGPEPHVHRHRHGRLVHSHPHVPDLHHRHRH